MIAIVLLGLLALASAVPKHSCHHHKPGAHSNSEIMNSDEFNSDEFNSDEFSMENALPGPHGHHFHHHHHFEDNFHGNDMSKKNCSCDLSKEIMKIDDLSKQFINNEPSIQRDGKEYKITLKLQGFDKKDLNVTVKKGQLAVQATRKVDNVPVINYFYIRTLPDNVGDNMTWTYENGLLKMVLSIKQVETPMKRTELPQNPQKMKINTDPNYNIDVRGGGVLQTNKKDPKTN